MNMKMSLYCSPVQEEETILFAQTSMAKSHHCQSLCSKAGICFLVLAEMSHMCLELGHFSVGYFFFCCCCSFSCRCWGSMAFTQLALQARVEITSVKYWQEILSCLKCFEIHYSLCTLIILIHACEILSFSLQSFKFQTLQEVPGPADYFEICFWISGRFKEQLD